jgi:hypothetical protein
MATELELEIFYKKVSEVNYSDTFSFEELLKIYDQLFKNHFTDEFIYDWIFYRESITLQIALSYLYISLNLNFSEITGNLELLKIPKDFKNRMITFEKNMIKQSFEPNSNALGEKLTENFSKIHKQNFNGKNMKKLSNSLFFEAKTKSEMNIHDLFYENSIQKFQFWINNFIRSRLNPLKLQENRFQFIGYVNKVYGYRNLG